METTLTANGYANDVVFENVEVINAGQYFGNTFMVTAGVGNVGIQFIVEAYTEADAIEVFAESKYGHLIVIDEETEQDAILDGCIDDYFYTESGYCDLSYFNLVKTQECKYSISSEQFWKLEIQKDLVMKTSLKKEYTLSYRKFRDLVDDKLQGICEISGDELPDFDLWNYFSEDKRTEEQWHDLAQEAAEDWLAEEGYLFDEP